MGKRKATHELPSTIKVQVVDKQHGNQQPAAPPYALRFTTGYQPVENGDNTCTWQVLAEPGSRGARQQTIVAHTVCACDAHSLLVCDMCIAITCACTHTYTGESGLCRHHCRTSACTCTTVRTLPHSILYNLVDLLLFSTFPLYASSAYLFH